MLPCCHVAMLPCCHVGRAWASRMVFTTNCPAHSISEPPRSPFKGIAAMHFRRTGPHFAGLQSTFIMVVNLAPKYLVNVAQLAGFDVGLQYTCPAPSPTRNGGGSRWISFAPATPTQPKVPEQSRLLKQASQNKNKQACRLCQAAMAGHPREQTKDHTGIHESRPKTTQASTRADQRPRVECGKVVVVTGVKH
jgi:hypothetical protein